MEIVLVSSFKAIKTKTAMETLLEINQDLRRADIYRLLANCFDFPDPERIDLIRDLSQGLAELGYPDEDIHSMIATLHSMIHPEEMLADYSKIFIKGGVPMSESYMLKRFASVADVTAYYAAFGFSAKTGENPDSIMYELEFLALLSLKLALAPDEESADITRQAYTQFLTDHAGEFALALGERIREGDAGAYFITVSHLLSAFISEEMARVNG